MDDSKPTQRNKPGTERARDERRASRTPRYGGGPWRIADERGDRRFGHARNDDAHPSELAPDQAEGDDHERELPTAADPEQAVTEAAGQTEASGQTEAAGQIESGGERAGMNRGERPRKVKARKR
jgi:hypothetical protein